MSARWDTVGLLVSAVVLNLFVGVVNASEQTELQLQEYQLKADKPFSSTAGKSLWVRDLNGRSCTSCHTDFVKNKGRHQRTGKLIEPMSPSENPLRLTDSKKVEKWFLRNCKWTLGRECTAQEKGDILLWLSQQ